VREKSLDIYSHVGAALGRRNAAAAGGAQKESPILATALLLEAVTLSQYTRNIQEEMSQIFAILVWRIRTRF